MPSSPEQVAERLGGEGVVSIARLHAGGNNQLYQVQYSDGREAVLKSYQLDEKDTRDRLAVEVQAFQFLRSRALRNVPEVLKSEPATGFALFEKIAGGDKRSFFHGSMQET